MRAYCPNCQLMFQSAVHPGMPRGAFIGNRESCPRCGELAHIEDAIGGAPRGFRIFGHAHEALRASDVAELEAFMAAARAVVAGDKSAETAAHDVAQVRDTFASLILFAKEWGLLHLLIAIVGIYVTWAVAQEGKDKTADDMLQELQRSNDIAAEALDELKRLGPRPSMQAPADIAPPTLPPIQRTSIGPAPPNRHTRRSANANRRRRGPPRL